MSHYFKIVVLSVLVLANAACPNRAVRSECSLVFNDVKIQENPARLPRSQQYYQVTPDQFAAEYVLQMNIGSQILFVVADTGSSNLIFEGDKSICSNCANDNTFSPSQTTTNLEQSFSIGYGSGHGLAYQYQDQVGLTCDPEPFDYTFGVLSTNQNLPNILGLGYEVLAEPGYDPLPPFFDQLIEKHQGKIRNAFSMLLCGHNTGSTIILGDIDPRFKEDEIRYTPIIQEKYYAIHAKHINVLDYSNDGGKWSASPGAVTKLADFPAFDPQKRSGEPTIVDSGTTMNLLPPRSVDQVIELMKAVNAQKSLGVPEGFWTATPGQPNYRLSLSEATIHQFPQIQIVIAGENSDSEDMNLGMRPESYFKALDPNTAPDVHTFSFRPASGINILGQVFMENFYVEFDRENKKIGFAPHGTFCQ